MAKNKQYYQLVTAGNTAELTIYGDITSFPWLESDVSAHNLSARLAELQGVSNINVYINSYGGEVAEGLAIYNALKRHPAQVTTYCDGFACSIASVIFMAGDERVMGNPSRLMIHDAWTSVYGANADELRKQADDLDNITDAFDIDAVNARAVFHIARHLRGRNQIGELPRGISLYLGGKAGFPGEGMAGRGRQTAGVDCIHALNHLEQPRTARHAPRLQRRRNG